MQRLLQSLLQPLLQPFLRLCALLCLLAGALPAYADTPIALFASYDGRVNFTGTQVTWRAYANNDYYPTRACTVYTPTSTLTANLTVPTGATVLAAHLYWAGSGTGDYAVSLQGTPVSATRRHTSTTVGSGLTYFGAGADVTSIVKSTGSGTYSFSGLTVATGDPWCASQAVLGGFSLLVVYSHPSEPERVLNLYEGFRYVQNSTVNVSASNFRWASPAFPVVEKARVGHITWEGDTNLSGGGERLMFEGKELTDTMNPTGNQFNSRSNINGDNYSYGVDFDAYDTTVTIWSGADAVVDTSYQTGQDLVLLGAEVLLVPTLPVSDMTVTLTGPAELQVSVPANYKIVLTNNGPYTAPAGVLKATYTLPAGMSFTSASGTNWTCAASGQTVTCSYSGSVAPGSSSTELTLTNAVTTTGDKLSKVVVSGADDDKPNNNSASHTATAKAAPVPPVVATYTYVFTKGACAPGVRIGAAGSGCTAYEGPRVAGDTDQIHVTALDANGVPAAQSKTAATPVKMKFSLTCFDPATNAGVKASYAGAELPLCTGGGEVPLATSASAWSPEVQLSFASGAASVPANFGYADVGSVQLNLLQGTNRSSARFVSRPASLAFRSITRGGVKNPGVTTPSGVAFAMAGEAVQVEVVALTSTGAVAPNFGKEASAPEVVLSNTRLNGDPTSLNYLPNAGALIEDPDVAWANGVRTSSVVFTEVGATRFIASLASYLGVSGVASAGEDVGRFYPAYYTTDLRGPFACPPEVSCPDDTTGPVPAVYSGQTFTGIVRPFSLTDDLIKNFVGPWYRPVTLTAAAPPSSTGTPGAALARQFATATWPTPAVGGEITGPLTYTLPNPYVTANPRAGNWTAPTTLFLRASSDDVLATTGSTTGTAIQVRSMRAPLATEEGGIVVINGRLRVNNALGTDVLRTPVGVRAEYWANGAWRTHAGFADTGGAVDGTSAQLSSCTRGLATAAAPPANCQAVVAGAAQGVNLVNGAGVVWLRAPGKLASGRTRDGSVNLQFPLRSWLPSTVGRVTFGTYRSPLIYVREVY